jgi:hypothetical protein
MPARPTFFEFLKAFGGRWFILMSGPASVPAAVAAAVVSNSVWRVLLACTAIACFLFTAYWIWRIERERRNEAESALALANDFTLTDWGNVRVADNPEVVALFNENGPERNKFLAFLTREHISCWARRMAPGYSDLVKVPGSVWNMEWFFDFAPKRPDDQRSINQTFIRDNKNNNAMFYDLYVNHTEMKRVWPTIELTQARDEVR